LRTTVHLRRHLQAVGFASTVVLLTMFALAQVQPRLFPFFPYLGLGARQDYRGTTLTAKPAPDFRLTDYTGQPLALSDLRGNVVVLTFLDPRCTDECPLIAQDLAHAVRSLGNDAAKVAVVAVNINLKAGVAEAEQFTYRRGLDRLPAWHFLSGPWEHVEEVVASYYVAAGDPKPGKEGEAAHQDVVYLIDTEGNLRYLLTWQHSPVGAMPFSDLVSQQLRSLLR
jgi:cytochrome oxidase Cu insertion factor (SCO1/SenC/PrrC family)